MTNTTEALDDASSRPTPWDPVLIELYEANYSRLVSCARRILGSTALAEEAVQEAFIAFRAVADRPAPGKELSYLRSIVCNNARGLLRRQAVADRHRYAGDAPECPEDLALNAIAVAHVRTAMTDLPRRQREVLVLRHWLALSERETSERLGISSGSVKTHASRGRATLRTSLVEVA